LDDETRMEHVLNNVQELYNIEVSKLEDRLGNLTDLLLLEEIQSALCLKYERMSAKKNKSKRYQQDEETALFAGGFKGKWNNCGRYGHKSRDCQEKKKTKNNNRNHRNDRNMFDRKNRDKDNNRKPFPYKCHYCKKEGHMAKDCFKKKGDERQKEKSANTTQDKEDEIGFVMLGLDDPENISE
jgi:Zinc knuckle